MLCKVVLLAGLAALSVGQEPPRPLPTWFLQSGLEGTFSERSAQCEELAPSKTAESSDGPIFIPETSEAEICINFPPLEEKNLKGGWRHDRGNKGACSNGCCEFKPPTKNQADVEHPAWFETTGDCASVPADLNKSPLLFQGKNGDKKTVCVEDEGAFRLDVGQLANCGGKCCIFYKDQE